MRTCFLFVLFLSLFSLYSFADSGSSLSGDLDLKAVMSDKVQNLSFGFCDDTKLYFDGGKVSYYLRPGQTKTFCANLSSSYTTGIVVKYAFVNGSLTEHNTIVCDQNLSTGDQNYFPFYQEDSYSLASQSSLLLRDRIHAPIAYTGTNYFCFVYWVDEHPQDKQRYIGGMFDIVVRKSVPLKIVVSGKPYRFQWWNDLVRQVKKLFIAK